MVRPLFEALLVRKVIAGGHAGVGVTSRLGAPLALPTLGSPEFHEFFLLGRTVRAVFPLGKGRVHAPI